MGLFDRLFEKGVRLDQVLYAKSGLERLISSLPPRIRSFGSLYGPAVALLTAVAVFAGALSTLQREDRVSTVDDPSGGTFAARDPGDLSETELAEIEALGESPTAAATARARQIARQFQAPPTVNVCGRDSVLDTGPVVQYPLAVQCLPPWSGDNGGETSRGVYRDKIRVALYVTRDPVVLSTAEAAGKTGPHPACTSTECAVEWANAFSEWFQKYYETYGRKIEIEPIEGSGPEGRPELATQDARRVIALDPPVFASLGGPGEAGAVYARELKSAGIMCFCTVSLPQEFYEKEMSPYVFSTLMASTQAYLHRAQYIGGRLAGRPAAHHGGDAAAKAQTRRFAFVWFDNNSGDYTSGADFFKTLMREKYGVSIVPGGDIKYVNIEGCQINATNMAIQLLGSGATSVIFAGDPICPIHLTKAAQQQGAKWEWIITGSVLTDTNALARLYDPDQWSRAFGVSMLTPAVKDENSVTYKMYKEMRPNGDWYLNVPLALGGPALLFRGVHLAGPNLNPNTFKEGMAKGIARGGTVTVPRSSFGPNNFPEFRVSSWTGAFWDHNSFDDMTEIWWDNTARDANNRERAYRYVDAARRWSWGTWPTSVVKAFDPEGTVTGYQEPPDM